MSAVKPETRFYTNINRLLPPKSVLHRQKIDGSTDNGTPDFWYSGSENDLWVEYKWIERKKKPIAIPHLLTSLQFDWIQRRYKEGRNVAVIVGTPEGGQIFVNGTWDGEYPVQSFVLSNKQIAEYIAEFCVSNDLSKGVS